MSVRRIVLSGEVARMLSSLSTLEGEEAVLLFGNRDGDSAVVSRAIRARCSVSSPTRFEVDPVFLLEKLEEADRLGEELVALFHNHPLGPPAPSAADLRHMEILPVVWVIGSRDGLRAYLLDGGLREVEVVVE